MTTGRRQAVQSAAATVPAATRKSASARLRLRDCVKPPVDVLFVGINPGMRSAAVGHHFAGYSNRFWSLLFESKLLPERITHDDDRRLPEWGFGITNVVPRATPGIDTIEPREYAAGALALKRKIRRWRPRVVACVGVTVFRSLFGQTGKVRLGLQRERLAGAEVFVLPNPSGRNAHHSIRQMRAAFRALGRHVARVPVPPG
jgi:TDG/mug DNA glycosylase family protein